jgi:hypothetical protein
MSYSGKSLLPRLVIVRRIASTTTAKGRTVLCRLDENAFDKGIKRSDPDMAYPNIAFGHHGDARAACQAPPRVR